MGSTLIALFIAIFILALTSAKNADTEDDERAKEVVRKPLRTKCGVRIGCYYAEVTHPRCGNGTVTNSENPNYSAEFMLRGCDGRRVEGISISWREIVSTAPDNVITSCRNRMHCVIPREMIRKRMGGPLLLEVSVSAAALDKVIRLGITLQVRAQDESISSKNRTSVISRTDHPGTKPSVSGIYDQPHPRVTRDQIYQTSRKDTLPNLILDYLSGNEELTSIKGGVQDDTLFDGDGLFSRNNQKRRKSRKHRRKKHQKTVTDAIKRKQIRMLDNKRTGDHVASTVNPRNGQEAQRNRNNKQGNNTENKTSREVSVWGKVERGSLATHRPPITTKSPTTTANTTPSLPLHTSTNVVNLTKTVNGTRSTIAVSYMNSKGYNVSRSHSRSPEAEYKDRPFQRVRANITYITNQTVKVPAVAGKGNLSFTKSGQPGTMQLSIHRKMEVIGNISDVNSAYPRRGGVTGNVGVRKSQTHRHNRHGSTTKTRKTSSELNGGRRILNGCLRYICGIHYRRKGHCPRLAILQCLRLWSGRNRQRMLGDIRVDVRRLIDMFNVSSSDLKEIETAAKASAHALMSTGVDSNRLSKNIGEATANVLRMLYNASYMASTAIVREELKSQENRQAIRGSNRRADWGDWGACSASCGQGQMTRVRLCIPLSRGNNGRCPGNDRQETSTCMGSQCRRGSGRMSPWSDWSPCSVTCGLGDETRTRRCIRGNVLEAGSGSTPRTGLGVTPRTGQGVTPRIGQEATHMAACKGSYTSLRQCIMSTCGKDYSTWVKSALLGYDTLLHCGQSQTETSAHVYWVTPRGRKVSPTIKTARLYMVDDTLVVHGAQGDDGGLYHCVIDQSEGSPAITFDTRLGDNMTGATCGAGDSHSSVTPDITFGFCEEVLTCASSPCHNGGTCDDVVHTRNGEGRRVTCTCLDGFAGRRCQNRIRRSHLHIYLLCALLLCLFLSTLIGFLAYCCVRRKSGELKTPTQDGGTKPDSEKHTLARIVEDEEPDVSINLDNSIVHDDDSWVEISEKDYKDFQGQNLFNFHQRNERVSSSLSQLHPRVRTERRTYSNIENRRPEFESMPNQTKANVFEVPTSPDIKTKILLIQPDSTTNDLKTKKSVSFQDRGHMTTESARTRANQIPPDPDGDYVDMSGTNPKRNELVIVTSDSVIGLHGKESDKAFGNCMEFVHRNTFLPQDSQVEVERVASDPIYEDMAPIYYTNWSIATDEQSTGEDMYDNACEYVHRSTYGPSHEAAHLYIDFNDETALSYGQQDHVNNHGDQGISVANTMYHGDQHPQETYLRASQESSMPEYAPSGYLSSDHETNYGNNSCDECADDQWSVHGKHHDVSCDNSGPFGKTDGCHRDISEADDEIYASDNSDTLLPMPDLDESELLDESCEEDTLEHSKIEAKSTVNERIDFDNIISFPFRTQSTEASADQLTDSSIFHVSLGNLLDGVENDLLSDICSSTTHKDTNSDPNETSACGNNTIGQSNFIQSTGVTKDDTSEPQRLVPTSQNYFPFLP